MEQQLATCIEQLDRGATFSLITECEPFTVINDYGHELGIANGAGVVLLIGLSMAAIIAIAVSRAD